MFTVQFAPNFFFNVFSSVLRCLQNLKHIGWKTKKLKFKVSQNLVQITINVHFKNHLKVTLFWLILNFFKEWVTKRLILSIFLTIFWSFLDHITKRPKKSLFWANSWPYQEKTEIRLILSEFLTISRKDRKRAYFEHFLDHIKIIRRCLE